jgi:hypothetical protein
MYLLLEKGMLDYCDVYIYSTTIYQPSYQNLIVYYDNLEKVAKQELNITHKIGHFIEVIDNNDDKLVNPESLDKSKNHIVIFDDVMTKDQSKIINYFCRGRHNNAHTFYLCQSLHKLAKHCIRQNTNLFILFRQDAKTVKYFWETEVSNDMKLEEFQKFCKKSWGKKHGFVIINLEKEPDDGRYMLSLEETYIPEGYQSK